MNIKLQPQTRNVGISALVRVGTLSSCHLSVQSLAPL